MNFNYEQKETNSTMDKSFKKIITIIICYIIAIYIQFAFLTPYKVERTYLSSQNVPHTVTIKSGYKCICKIGSHDIKDEIIQTENINYTSLFFNLGLTTLITAFIVYSIKRDSHQSTEKELYSEISNLKEEIKTLKTIINNSKILQSLKNKNDLPNLDINSLAFADSDTQEIALSKYNTDIENYLRNKMIRDYLLNNVEKSDFQKIAKKEYIACVLDFETRKIKNLKFAVSDLPNNFIDLLDEHGNLYIKRILVNDRYTYIQISKQSYDSLKIGFSY